MQALNGLPSEFIGVVGVVDPDANTTGAITTAYVHKNKFHSFLGIVQTGDLGSSATLDAKWVEADDASGTNVQDVTGGAITQLTQAGTDSNKQVVMNFLPDRHGSPSKPYLALVQTVGTATSDSNAIVLGVGPRYGPATNHDLATVDEVKTPTNT